MTLVLPSNGLILPTRPRIVNSARFIILLSIVGAAPRCDGFDGNGRKRAEPNRGAVEGARPERSGGPEAKGNFASGARRPLARNAQRAGENSREHRVLAFTDGHRKTPMQPGRRLRPESDENPSFHETGKSASGRSCAFDGNRHARSQRQLPLLKPARSRDRLGTWSRRSGGQTRGYLSSFRKARAIDDNRGRGLRTAHVG